MKSFDEAVDELKAIVGHGVLEAEISVNQVYAHWIDGTPDQIPGRSKHKFSVEFDHPHGGEAQFLSGQIPEKRDSTFAEWAREALRGGLVRSTIRIALEMRDQVFMRAPVEFGMLHNSTSIKVSDHGEPVFYTPALVPRLSEAEIKAIRRAGDAGTRRTLPHLGRIV